MPSIFSYYNFLLKSSTSHGVHSPFVYDLVSLCLRKKRETVSLYKELAIGFPSSIKAKHVRILNDFVAYLDIQNYAHFCGSEHPIDNLPFIKLLNKTTHKTADLIYVPDENFNLHHTTELISELKNEGILVIENPYSNPEVWKSIKENPLVYICIDTYFFGFIFNRKQQAKEHFKIRI